MTAWLHIIGVGEKGPRELTPSARMITGYAEFVLGPARFLDALDPVPTESGKPDPGSPEIVNQRNLEAVARALLDEGEEKEKLAPAGAIGDTRTLIEWQPPLDRMIAQVLGLRGHPTVILATGDPMWFGIGATLARHLDAGEFDIHPHPSAFQLAAARLHWPLQSVSTLSLHGRPVQAIHPHIVPGNRILALTTDRHTLDEVAEILVDRGYGRSRVWALQNLGAADENVVAGEAEGFDSRAVEDFYVLAVDCLADPGAALLPTVPGLPDSAFVNDGQLTKREVRATTIAKLAPFPGALLWDVGAGCGSIGIEWMRAVRDARAIAIEREGERLHMIAVNAAALGVPGLEIVAGEAPQSLRDLPAPDAIFLGGDVANEDLFDACWQVLVSGGRLVANAVTIEGEQALYARQQRLGGELTRIEVSVLDTVGQSRVLRPRMAVTQWLVTKAEHGMVISP